MTTTQNLNIQSETSAEYMRDFEQALITKFGINAQELHQLFEEHSLTKKKGKFPKETKTPKPRKTDKEQCEARVWGDGSGKKQCPSAAGPTGLCGKHARLEQECSVPCTTTNNGTKRVGLFMGRVTHWQDGVEGILPFKDQNNVVRIDWACHRTLTATINQVDEGRATFPPKPQLGSKWLNKRDKALDEVLYLAEIAHARETSPSPEPAPEPKPKTAKKTSKKSTAAAELAAIVQAVKKETSPEPAPEPETSPEPAPEPETSSEPAPEPETSPEPAPEPETSSEPAAKQETSSEPAAEQENTEVVENNEDEDDAEEANVEEKIHDGKTWVVDSDDQTIYFWDEDDERHGATIGKWTEDGPELDEEWKWMID